MKTLKIYSPAPNSCTSACNQGRDCPRSCKTHSEIPFQLTDVGWVFWLVVLMFLIGVAATLPN